MDGSHVFLVGCTSQCTRSGPQSSKPQHSLGQLWTARKAQTKKSKGLDSIQNRENTNTQIRSTRDKVHFLDSASWVHLAVTNPGRST